MYIHIYIYTWTYIYIYIHEYMFMVSDFWTACEVSSGHLFFDIHFLFTKLNGFKLILGESRFGIFWPCRYHSSPKATVVKFRFWELLCVAGLGRDIFGTPTSNSEGANSTNSTAQNRTNPEVTSPNLLAEPCWYVNNSNIPSTLWLVALEWKKQIFPPNKVPCSNSDAKQKPVEWVKCGRNDPAFAISDFILG